MTNLGGMIGSSPAFMAAITAAERLAPTPLSVVISGPSGTGKELLARFLHQCSRRAHGPFVAANCGAFSKELHESELFGHEKGAFTGALAKHIGCFERAHAGTIFLDEVGDLAPDLQVKLLRVLQEGEVLRLGATEVRKIDVRIVAATNRNLGDLVVRGKFREDLYYRLQSAVIDLPPLCERGMDVIDIADSYLRATYRDKPLSPDAKKALLAHSWPGNIRELQSVLGSSAALSTTGMITAAMVKAQIETLGVESQARRAREQRRARRTRARCRMAIQHRGADAGTNREEVIMGLVKKRGAITPADARTELGLGKSITSKLLATMEARGQIVRRCKGPQTHYVAGDAPAVATESDRAVAHVPTDRQREILCALGTAPSLAFPDIRRHVSHAPCDRTLRADLLRLKHWGLVRSQGAGRGARWMLEDAARDLVEA